MILRGRFSQQGSARFFSVERDQCGCYYRLEIV